MKKKISCEEDLQIMYKVTMNDNFKLEGSKLTIKLLEKFC